VPGSLVEQIGGIWNTLQAAGMREGPPETKPSAVSHCPIGARRNFHFRDRKSNSQPAIRMRFIIYVLSVFENRVLRGIFGPMGENGIRMEKKYRMRNIIIYTIHQC
jgi:hypothetical protein